MSQKFIYTGIDIHNGNQSLYIRKTKRKTKLNITVTSNTPTDEAISSFNKRLSTLYESYIDN